MQPWGYIFQNKFLGEVQLKKYLKTWEKKWGSIRENPPKTGLFTLPGALFKSGVVLARIL